MQRGRVLLLLGAAGCSTGPGLRAQDSIPWPAGNHLHAVVHAMATTGALDTVRVSYTVSNLPSSEQQIALLIVRATGQVASVRGPVGWYSSYAVLNDSSVASWSSMVQRANIPAGGTLGGFTVTGIGWLDFVGYRAEGDYSIPVVSEDSAHLIQRPPSVWVNAFAGLTLGIVPALPSASTADQLARLADQTRQSCRLGWLESGGTCTSLLAKLDAAAGDLARHRATAVAGSVQAFLAELQALPDSLASEEAKALLSAGAEWILRLGGRL